MKDRGGEGVEDLEDGGSKAPPILQEALPLPLPDSRDRESQPKQGAPPLRCGVRREGARGRGSRGIHPVSATC